MIPTDDHLLFERVDAVHDSERGVVADLHGEQLCVDVVRPDVVRLRISRGGVLDDTPTYAVCVDPLGEPAAFEVDRQPDRVLVRTEELVVSLWLDPFRLDVHRRDGSPVIETAQDEDGRYWAYATLNDAFTLRRRARPDDAFHGLGEKTGAGNRRGRDFVLWNTDVLNPASAAQFTAGLEAGDPRADERGVHYDPFYVSIPFLYHQRHPSGAMAGSFVDNGYRGDYELSPAQEYRIHFSGGQYTEYVFAGPGMREILGAYTWLTGRAALPPLWALGYHQSRWADYTQDDVEAIAARHRAEDIPCDALWLDIEYMDGYRVFTWDDQAFPDPAAMLARLGEQGFRVVTIIDPGIKHDPGWDVYDEAVERDVLARTEGGDVYIGQVWPGRTAFPDFVTPEARAWWGELNAAHVRSGLAGIWNDMNEPATGTIDPSRMRFDRGRASHERYHNQYALLMAMATTAGLREAMPELRTFVLSRAGSAGIQRYAANWMGDNLSRWDHLALSIPMAAGLGVSGQPFVGADIGGFAGHSEPELFLRWMQHGTLTPFCRNHSERDNVDQYAWSFGPAVQDVVRRALQLRYRLMPYLYSAFVEAGLTGVPVQRPLVLDYQDDRTARDIDDQYLLGGDLLVAPVLEPGMTARQVYLPQGTWVDWHTGTVLEGGAHVLAPTPMETIPLYARGGSVVPLWPEVPASTAGHHPRTIELHLFVPTRDGEHTSWLQEDDGVTFAAQEGGCLRTRFRLTRSGHLLRVVADVQGQGYAEFARTRFALVVHGGRPDHVVLDGRRVEAEDGRFMLPDEGTGFSLELTLDG